MNIDNSYYTHELKGIENTRYTTLIISNRCLISGGRQLAKDFARLELWRVDYDKL